MTLTSTSSDYMWGVSSTGVSYIYTGNGKFIPLARLPFFGVIQIAPEKLVEALNKPFTSIQEIEQAVSSLGGAGSLLEGGGISAAYSFVDKNNVLYTNSGKKVLAIGLKMNGVPLLGLKILRELDAVTFLQGTESITGLVLTYDGKLVVLGTRSVSVINRDFSGSVHTLRLNDSESISNSAAVDENNGIYVVSDKNMYKFVWTGTTLSKNTADGAWVSSYDSGDTYPTIFGSGSGATPTLMGFGDDEDKLVVITDGVKRMKLVAFWRNALPTEKTTRIADSIPVTCGLPTSTEYIQSDQSVAVNGYGAFVVNNVAEGASTSNVLLVNIIARGPILPSPRGIERFEWDPQAHVWKSIWSRADISSNSMVPGISSVSNRVFVSGYYTGSGWEVRGLDWINGQVQHTTLFGKNIFGNGAYALLQFLPNGDMLFNSLIGPGRISLPEGIVYPT